MNAADYKIVKKFYIEKCIYHKSLSIINVLIIEFLQNLTTKNFMDIKKNWNHKLGNIQTFM